jgi:hypothetical protein
MEGTGARGGTHQPPSDVTGGPSHVGGTGWGWYNDPCSAEEGDENRREGAPVKREAIPGCHIDKLLNDGNHGDVDYLQIQNTKKDVWGSMWQWERLV